MRPMLASQGTRDGGRVPSGPDWRHEVKWDGIRLLAEVRDGGLRLFTRSERDVTPAFPELTGLAAVANDLLLDGEAVSLTGGGPHNFSEVVSRIHTSSARRGEELARAYPVTYLVFDLLRLDGLDLRELPWQHRRAALEDLLNPRPSWQVSPVYEDGAQLLAATADQDLEGIISKRVTAPYLSGQRSTDWLKFSHRPTRSWVVGGWRPETGRSKLGSVLVGSPVTGGGLAFRGRVGSGLAGRAGAQLAERLAEVPEAPCPFIDEVPRADASGARWIRPEVVVDVAAKGGVTDGGRLRQPSYQGWRPDLTPADVEQE